MACESPVFPEPRYLSSLIDRCWVCGACDSPTDYRPKMSQFKSQTGHKDFKAFCSIVCPLKLGHEIELDRYIGNTHHRGRLWDNRYHRKHRQMMTIGDQSVPMFHDDVTH